MTPTNSAASRQSARRPKPKRTSPIPPKVGRASLSHSVAPSLRAAAPPEPRRRRAGQGGPTDPKSSGPQAVGGKASPAPPASASAQPFLRNKTNGAAGNTPNEKSSLSTVASSLVPPKPLDLSKERTITVKEAAFRLRKSECGIHFWLRTGRLRGWQPGGRGCAVLICEASVEEALLCRVGVGGTA